jgi:ribonuclease HI
MTKFYKKNKKHIHIYKRNFSIPIYQTSVFTDGSVLNNGKKNARGGIGVFFKKEDTRNCSEPFFLQPITNNRAELYAVIRAVQNYAQNSYWNPATQGFSKTRKFYDKRINKVVSTNSILTVYTDSEFVINVIQKWIYKWKINHWKTVEGKPIKNQDLIICLYELIEYYKNRFIVQLIHTKAHRDSPKNKESTDYKLWYGNFMADRLSKMTYHRQFRVDASTIKD